MLEGPPGEASTTGGGRAAVALGAEHAGGCTWERANGYRI